MLPRATDSIAFQEGRDLRRHHGRPQHEPFDVNCLKARPRRRSHADSASCAQRCHRCSFAGADRFHLRQRAIDGGWFAGRGDEQAPGAPPGSIRIAIAASSLQKIERSDAQVALVQSKAGRTAVIGEAKKATAVALASGRGVTLNAASTMTPSVPNEPR